MTGESEPQLNLNVNGEAIEARRDNTTLYTFLGHMAIYNHVFIVTDEEQPSGFYLFNDHPVYPEMADFLARNDYPMHLNMSEVAECDTNAYDRHIDSLCHDIGDTIPESWND